MIEGCVEDRKNWLGNVRKRELKMLYGWMDGWNGRWRLMGAVLSGNIRSIRYLRISRLVFFFFFWYRLIYQNRSRKRSPQWYFFSSLSHSLFLCLINLLHLSDDTFIYRFLSNLIIITWNRWLLAFLISVYQLQGRGQFKCRIQYPSQNSIIKNVHKFR